MLPVVFGVSSIQSFAYDGKTVIVAATLSDIKKAEQGKGDMDSKKLVRIPSKVGDLFVLFVSVPVLSPLPSRLFVSVPWDLLLTESIDRKSTRLNSSHAT